MIKPLEPFQLEELVHSQPEALVRFQLEELVRQLELVLQLLQQPELLLTLHIHQDRIRHQRHRKSCNLQIRSCCMMNHKSCMKIHSCSRSYHRKNHSCCRMSRKSCSCRNHSCCSCCNSCRTSCIHSRKPAPAGNSSGFGSSNVASLQQPELSSAPHQGRAIQNVASICPLRSMNR